MAKYTPDTERLEQDKTLVNSLFPNDGLKVSSGYSNTVIFAKGTQGTQIFRFPNNKIIENMMTKEAYFCTFIEGKLSVATPNLKLHNKNGRIFTQHSMLEGETLYERMQQGVSKTEMQQISKGIVGLIQEMRHLPTESITPAYQNTTTQQIESIINHYGIEKNHELFKMLYHLEKQELHLTHGDFNSKNILVKDNQVCGLIDFNMTGLSNHHLDLSRIVGYIHEPQNIDILLGEFNKQNKSNVQYDFLENIRTLRIEQEGKIVQKTLGQSPAPAKSASKTIVSR